MNHLRMPFVNIVFTLLFCCFIQRQPKAESYYCWAMSGLLFRAVPFTDAKILGKLEYGQKIEISNENRYQGVFHKVVFLPGLRKKEENTDEIYLEDY
ncbi:MAG: hypothetical protein WAT79_13445 [Saprospiraceae bacterium]